MESGPSVGYQELKMVRIQIDMFIPFVPSKGQDITWNIPGRIAPVRAIALEPVGCNPGGMPEVCEFVELTFTDWDHAREWMREEGMSNTEIAYHRSRIEVIS